MAYFNCLLMDADDTVFDFAAAERGALCETLQNFGIEPEEAVLRQYHEINEGLWKELEKGAITLPKLQEKRYFLLLQALQRPTADAAKMNVYYMQRLAMHGEVLDGAEDALRELSEVATLALVTNGIEKVQQSRLQLSGLAKYFDGNFVSGRIGAPKPNRKIFDFALDTLGIVNRKKVLVVGDSLSSDIRGGINAGLATCWLNPTGQENTTDIKPTFTVKSLDELYRYVMEQEELQNVGLQERRHSLPIGG